MKELCLFIKVKTSEGKRDQVLKLWEKHLKERAFENVDQKTYYFCFDDQNPDVICMFEHYSNPESLHKNASKDWFKKYMMEVMPFLDGEPEVNITTPVWIK